MSILGTKVLRKEDRRFLVGAGRFMADLSPRDDPRLAQAAWVTFVRSPLAHGTITGIDVTEALDAEGVIDVVVHDDIDITAPPIMGGALGDDVIQPFLANGRVRFAGEAVAAVITEEPGQGPDAAELVVVDYEPLDAVPDVLRGLEGDVLLFDSMGTNISQSFGKERDEHLFDGCEVVVRARLVNQRLAPCPLEPRGCAAVWDGDHLTFWASTQSVHSVRKSLMQQLDLSVDHVRVIAPDVGGGFGAKMNLYREESFAAWAARKLGRAVRWIETRSESMVGLNHGRGQIQDIEIGGSRDGDVQAYRLEVIQDAGAYPGLGSFLPYFTRLMAQGTYDIDRVEASTRSVMTTTTATGAYRGAGRPEACAAIERSMDLFAAEIGMDPAEVRRRNLIQPDQFPFETKTGATYDVGDYPGALSRALEAAGYEELRAEQARRRESGDKMALGIGVSCYVEITAGPTGGEKEFARVAIETDGAATVFTGSSSHGQGHATSWSMIASELTGIPIEEITVIHGDTDLVPQGVGTWGSRSLQVGGSAVHRATGQVVERAIPLAADLLESSPEDVVLDTERGHFHIDGAPDEYRTWAEVAKDADEPISETHEFVTESPSFPFGAHVAVVEVDTETGAVTLERIVAVDDAGRVLNPLIVDGQRHGGIAQGVAQALMEEVVYDGDANPQTANLADYGMISATELPDYELVVMETPTPLNALGAKGVGESGTIGATPAVQSAVVDAVSHLGVTHIDMPCTAERVWNAIDGARKI